MRKLLQASCAAWVVLLAIPAWADAGNGRVGGAHIGRHVTSPEDVAAITQVTADFQKASIDKDERALSALVFNSNILFVTPVGPATVQAVRARRDVNFDGVTPAGFPAFARFVGASTKPIEEKFYNIKITQDGHMAWVMFDFEFVEDNQVGNYGVETWQMYKVDGKWKILSVVWSSHGAPT